MADMHTPLPWAIKNRQDTIEIVGADGVAVAKTSWHNSLRRPYPLRAEAAANMTLIVASVNAPSQDAETIKALREALDEQITSTVLLARRLGLSRQDIADCTSQARAALAGSAS